MTNQFLLIIRYIFQTYKMAQEKYWLNGVWFYVKSIWLCY